MLVSLYVEVRDVAHQVEMEFHLRKVAPFIDVSRHDHLLVAETPCTTLEEVDAAISADAARQCSLGYPTE